MINNNFSKMKNIENLKKFLIYIETSYHQLRKIGVIFSHLCKKEVKAINRKLV